MLTTLTAPAFAGTWYIEDGDITISAGESGNNVTQNENTTKNDPDTIITNREEGASSHTVTIDAKDKDDKVEVTLKDVNIDASSGSEAAVSVTGKGDTTIELDGDNELKSGAGHAGLEHNKTDTSGELTIQDKDNNGSLEAAGGFKGAGIGSAGSNDAQVKITGGNITATSDDWGAGIGSGSYGTGTVEITGGEINATGGYLGAGIGGGEYGIGKDIIITGGEVNATGGRFSAGIGGGSRGTGSDITISGGEVNASGGVNGAGIGGGLRSKGKDITVSGDTKLKVQGGDEDHYDGAGAGIGDGGSNAYGTKILGAEVEPDTSGLTTNGSIAYYAPGADMENDKPTSITFGTSSQPEKPIEPAVPEQPEAERGMDAPLYRVTDKDGRDIVYTAERKDGVLTVNVDEDFAILTGRLSGIRTLKAQGVEKIIFVTKGATSAFMLSDLLEKGESGDTYKLTHDGKAVTFTLGEKMTDVSAILTKP